MRSNTKPKIFPPVNEVMNAALAAYRPDEASPTRVLRDKTARDAMRKMIEEEIPKLHTSIMRIFICHDDLRDYVDNMPEMHLGLTAKPASASNGSSPDLDYIIVIGFGPTSLNPNGAFGLRRLNGAEAQVGDINDEDLERLLRGVKRLQWFFKRPDADFFEFIFGLWPPPVDMVVQALIARGE